MRSQSSPTSLILLLPGLRCLQISVCNAPVPEGDNLGRETSEALLATMSGAGTVLELKTLAQASVTLDDYSCCSARQLVRGAGTLVISHQEAEGLFNGESKPQQAE